MSQNGKEGGNLKRTVLIVVGTLLGFFFLYLAFRGVSWHDFVEGVSKMQPIYLIPATITVLLIQLVRALRFGVIVRPICSLTTKELWDLLNLWAAAGMVLPARLGEFVRPYLLQGRGTSFSSTFGAVMVERFFDLTGLLLLLAVVLWKTPQVPPQYSFVGKAMLAALTVGYIVVLVILSRREAAQVVIDKVLSVLPTRIGSFLGGIIRSLIEGFSIMASFRQAVIILTYSVTLWILFSCVTYLFLMAFSIKASFLVAVTIQVFLCLGVALPTAPGFVGTFHAAGRYALAVFGIQAVAAISFATVYHLFSLVINILLGVISYSAGSFTFDHKIFSRGEEQPGNATVETARETLV
jgi:glycosyltransferase 2 family protein